MRPQLLNAFKHRDKIINILKRKAAEYGLKEEWILENWWIDDDERGYLTLHIGEPKSNMRVAHILADDVIEL